MGAFRSSTAYLPSHWDSVSCARCSADASRTSSVAVGLGLLLAVAQDMSWGGRASAAIRGSGIVRKPAGRSSLSHVAVVDNDDGDDDDGDIRSSVGNKEDFLARYSVTSRLVVSATFAFIIEPCGICRNRLTSALGEGTSVWTIRLPERAISINALALPAS